MKRYFILTTILMLAGCVTSYDHLRPGYLSEANSVYDGAREVTLRPAWTMDSENLKLGLFWRSPMKNDVLLVAEALEAHNFNPDASLRFKIDGVTHTLKPVYRHDYGEVKTDFFGSVGGVNQSQKVFQADKAFIERLLNAKYVVVRADLLRSYVEGRFSMSQDEVPQYSNLSDLSGIYAYNGFQKFYDMVWGDG